MVEYGKVKIEHHSTPSLIEVTIVHENQIDHNEFEVFDETVWFDYGTLSDFYNAIKLMPDLISIANDCRQPNKRQINK